MDSLYIENLLKEAFREDMPFGDITTDNVFNEDDIMKSYMVAKEDGVICGIEIAKKAFLMQDSDVRILFEVKDGTYVHNGDKILEIEGKTKGLLKAERTALNILQRMSGIASITRKYVELVKDMDVRIVDTRKTTPLLRPLEKYSVRIGGGHNHRYCLSDAVMLKDNHIDALGGLQKAVETVREKIPHTTKIEVEVETIDGVKEALLAKADIIMLDNMSNEMMKEAVKLVNKRAIVEASGNVNLERLASIAKTGVDVISVGKLTHSVRSMDISMKVQK